MNLFDVYPVYDLNIIRAKGTWVYDETGQKYLDFYGGHAVISIGHSHPHYVEKIQSQIEKIGFYSNSVINNLQADLAKLLGEASDLHDYQLFLINSGAEANENALKLASFHNGRKKIVSFHKGFHGRTSAAVNVTDNPKIIAPLNKGFENICLEMGDADALGQALSKGDIAAIILEPIQGVAGIYEASRAFLEFAYREAKKYHTLLIVDEVQAGYGRSGDFFSYQIANIQPDLISIAKGMGNGFPIGGVLIHPDIRPSYGLLGTTYGGNHLACAAATAVLEVIRTESLLVNAKKVGQYLKDELEKIAAIREVRGRGLMLGLELGQPVKEIRKKLLLDEKVFVGSAANPNTLRLLPPLNISQAEAELCLAALRKVLSNNN